MYWKKKKGDMPASELLLSRLTTIQKEDGYLPEERLKFLSEEMDIPITRIYEVATFYSFFNVNKKGNHIIRVCSTPSCYINGSENILKIFEKILGIKTGETTMDNKFTLEKTSCIGCCNEAPAAMIDGKACTKLTENKIKEILKKCK